MRRDIQAPLATHTDKARRETSLENEQHWEWWINRSFDYSLKYYTGQKVQSSNYPFKLKRCVRSINSQHQPTGSQAWAALLKSRFSMQNYNAYSSVSPNVWAKCHLISISRPINTNMSRSAVGPSETETASPFAISLAPKERGSGQRAWNANLKGWKGHETCTHTQPSLYICTQIQS